MIAELHFAVSLHGLKSVSRRLSGSPPQPSCTWWNLVFMASPLDALKSVGTWHV